MTVSTAAEAPAPATGFAYDGGLTCAINVTDLDRSTRWYQGVLGMTLLYRIDDIAWCEFSTAVANVTVGLAQVETVAAGGGATLTFGVTDIAAAQRALDAAGVRQDGPVQHVPGMVSLLTFYDPDGNALMFYQDQNAAPSR